MQKKTPCLVDGDYAYWRAIQRAIATGELREDVDVEDAVVMFRQVYMGLSFEMAFMGGLNTPAACQTSTCRLLLIKALNSPPFNADCLLT